MPSQFFQNNDRPLVFGHRGVVAEHQENTLAGFKKAIALGLDGVELDTFLTKDDKLIVFHDLYTERLTGVSGKITKMTWAEIQKLNIQQTLKIGKKKVSYPQPEAISLLEDVLEETRGKLLVNIEIKAPDLNWKQRKTGIAVANLIKQMKLENQVFATSFSPWSLIWLKLTYPNIESGLLYAPMMIKNQLTQKVIQSTMTKKIINSSLVSLNVNLFKKRTIERLHHKNLAVGAWTIFSRDNTPNKAKKHQKELDLIKKLTQQKIDYFITDDPVRLNTILSQFISV